MTDFKTIHSEKIFSGRAFSIRKDQVELPNGEQTSLEVVEHVGAVALVPYDEQRRIWFVRQYRYPAGEDLLELPAGTLGKSEAPESCAHREIREETGMAAGKLWEIGSFYMAPGYSTELLHIFMATDLHPSPLPQDQDEFLQVVQIPIEQVYAMAKAREIHDGKTLAALLLAEPILL